MAHEKRHSVIKRAVSMFAAFAIAVSASALSITASSEASGGYGPNGKFLAPIEAPKEGSIEIGTREDLEKIGRVTGFALNASYVLTADIDLAGSDWVPLPGGTFGYNGTFDGQGHVIKNMTITGPKYYSGLFEAVGSPGTIKNLGMEGTLINVTCDTDSNPSRRLFAGAIAAVSGSGEFINCYSEGSVKGSVTEAYGSGEVSVGGLIGFHDYGNGNTFIKNCCNRSSVTCKSYAMSYVGGIAGESTGTSGVGAIANSCNYGNISSLQTCPATITTSPFVYVGGIVGEGDNLIECTNEGNVTATSNGLSYAGGLAGYLSSCGKLVENGINNGTITATAGDGNAASEARASFAGGLVGASKSGVSFTGGVNNGSIQSTANLDSQSRKSYAGGILGNGDGGAFTDCMNFGPVKSELKGDSGGITHEAFAAGIAGRSNMSSTLRCGNYADIYSVFPSGFDGTASGLIGGHIGDSVIQESTNKGNITSSHEAAGLVDWSGIVKNSYNSGTVRGESAGGITKRMLVYSETNTIDKSYNSGSVIGSSQASGIAVEKESTSNEDFTVSNSAVLSPSITGSSSYAVAGADITASNNYVLDSSSLSHDPNFLISEQVAKTQVFYETALGWDFNLVWKMPKSLDGYPLLMWEKDNSEPPAQLSPTIEPPPEATEPEPSDAPSAEPSDTPSSEPSDTPSSDPSDAPSSEPSDAPSAEPSEAPSSNPSESPSAEPSDAPSETPSSNPSESPSSEPSDAPSAEPSDTPSSEPSETPSSNPSELPSSEPSEPVATDKPSPSVAPSPTIIVTPSPKATVTPSPKATVTPSPKATV
ncbi:MAG: hypothetical protein LBC41_07150, partial [Clostridiales bacterium]|nr:hypothetical protein [Clostridiales bacterium]